MIKQKNHSIAGAVVSPNFCLRDSTIEKVESLRCYNQDRQMGHIRQMRLSDVFLKAQKAAKASNGAFVCAKVQKQS
jgi:hypothetical protein